jgi:serine acetyltransferase
MPKLFHPKNPHLGNPKIAIFFLHCLRNHWSVPGKLLGLLLNCELPCKIPDRLFLPHPYGIVLGRESQLSNDVAILQQVNLGCRKPYGREDGEDGYPVIKEGAYLGPGAKIMGPVVIGEWAVIGANAVITVDVPPYAVAVGYNKILDKKSTDF